METAALIILTCAFGAIIYLQQRLIAQLQREKSDIMDRWNLSKGLPPQNINVQKAYAEKQERLEEKKRTSLPRSDQLTKGRHALILEEQQRIGMN